MELHAGELPAGVGHSSETVAFELRSADGSVRDVILRLAPVGSAVFPTYDLSVQVHALRCAAACSAAPVPEVLAEDLAGDVLGRPMFVMDRVQGLVPADGLPYTMGGWLFDAAPEQQELAWTSTLRAMAALHCGSYDEADLAALRPHGRPDNLLAAHLQRWQGYAHWVLDGRGHPTIDDAGRWLHEHQPVALPPSTLLWGDARLSNVVFQEYRAVALLDWEMATVGPAEVDLAWFCFFADFFGSGLGVDDLAGFPPRDVTINAYEEALGRTLQDLRWYEVFAAWRHCAIMARIADLWEAAGDLPAGSDARLNNPATRMLAAMLDLPSPGPPGGPMG